MTGPTRSALLTTRVAFFRRLPGDGRIAVDAQSLPVGRDLERPRIGGKLLAGANTGPLGIRTSRVDLCLSTQNTAVIATVNSDGSPAATPVRFYSLGFEIFYTSWNDSPKSRNLRRDPRVSAGIVAPLVGQASSRGAQIFGMARTLERDDPDAAPYWEAFRWQSDHVERGRRLDEPPTDPLTVITPERIVYTEHWLRKQGYRPRQIWRPE
ncbi:MAG: pyridoxamine 5'-phosphate oxidase family protein [Microbacteriaceae bacterium]|nr:pyridoxamine 5'-phosphate oxidase family protein [Microbacteriaceae bacterium]MCL2795206.1 pyridoxamine 5'-phosphate oxidase family protein [Microbacteriaceae bacterium]